MAKWQHAPGRCRRQNDLLGFCVDIDSSDMSSAFSDDSTAVSLLLVSEDALLDDSPVFDA